MARALLALRAMLITRLLLLCAIVGGCTCTAPSRGTPPAPPSVSSATPSSTPRQRCQVGDEAACVVFATSLDQNTDLGELRPYVEAGCKRGSRTACELAAIAVTDHDLTADLNTRLRDAAPYLERGCALGSLDSCEALASLLVDGHGIAQDVTRGIALRNRACDGGGKHSCLRIAQNLDDAGDHAAAVPRYQQACDLGSVRACIVLGIAYADGRGVAADQARALELLDTACKAVQDHKACEYRDEVEQREYPLRSVDVRVMTFGYGSLGTYSTTRAEAKRRATQAARALARGEDFITVATKYADPEVPAEWPAQTIYMRRSADRDEALLLDRLFQLPPGSATMFERSTNKFFVYFRPPL